MPRKILIVDDSRTMRDMVTFTLKSEGHQVIEAEDGEHALQQLGGQSIDLVITDVNMPKMDGITLVGKLRSQPQYKTAPILVLTTESDDSMRQKGRAAGATGWIVKPFDPDKLITIVNKVCP